MVLGKVGSKGELFPPKKIRELAGLKEGKKVLYRVVNGRLIVERIYSPEEILRNSDKIDISLKEIKKERKNLLRIL